MPLPRSIGFSSVWIIAETHPICCIPTTLHIVTLREGHCPSPTENDFAGTLTYNLPLHAQNCPADFSAGQCLLLLVTVPAQHSFAPAGMASSIISRFSFSSPFSVWTAEISMPQDSRPIIFLGGRLVMATKVLPIRSSGL